MSTVKIVKRDVTMSVADMKHYSSNTSVRRSNRATNLRFGKFGFTTDADVDG